MRTEPQPDGSVRDCSHFQALVPVGPRGPPAPSSGPRAGPAGVTCPQRQVDEATCALASEIARSARPLHVLAPPSTWARPQTDAWVSALVAFARRITPALSGSDQDKVDLVIDWLRLPAQVLSPFLQASATHCPKLKAFMASLAGEGNPLAAADDQGPDRARARACEKRLKWGEKVKALRVLLSAGIGNEHPRGEAIMRQMHPAPRHPIVAPNDLGPGLNASDGAVAAALTHLFKTDYTSMDFSGWSMSLLRPVKGRPDVMDPITGLIRAIANCDMPLEVYWLITAGSLVALHKLDVNAQAARALAGLDPKLRPVNKSALLWKCATQVAIGHAEYDRACKLMQPAERPAADADGLAPAPQARAAPGSAEIKHGPQLGLGAKLGMPRMAFTAQELYAEGYSIAECDGANAFNEASRQKMLEAVRRECPHMTRLFWMGYCSHSPLVLMRLGKSFAVLHSQEGARMGDKFGSFVYCLTVHPAYIEIMERCPSVVVQAATDDLKGYARDPLDLCRMLPIAAEALERHAGVKLNVDKSAILLPRGVSDPDVTRLPPGAVVRDGYLLMPLGVEQHEHKIELKRDGMIGWRCCGHRCLCHAPYQVCR